ncbi:MAG: TIGR01777 family oxidoreductase [Thermoleophilaceae bacterium]
MKRVTVTGGTGFIGRQVVDALRARGDEVTVLSRSATGSERWADPVKEPPPADALAGRDGVVHLLGENVAQRWTDKAKRRIRESRELGTRNLVQGLADLSGDERPGALVSMSAVGFYGARGDERVDESEPAGDDFLAEVVKVWEAEARQAAELGIRVATPRTGVVLAEGGGALDKMLPPFKLGVGGPVAGGRQYVPWVHLDDVVGAMLFLLDGGDGTYNLTAPEPVTNKELSKALGRALHRPAIAPVPALAVKALYGDMAWIVTTGVRAVPKRLLEEGYSFARPDLDDALRAAVS